MVRHCPNSDAANSIPTLLNGTSAFGTREVSRFRVRTMLIVSDYTNETGVLNHGHLATTKHKLR